MLFLVALVATSDPLFAQQRSLELIHAEEAWAITQGNASQRVGIVDTGLIRDHEDIADKDAGGYDFLTAGDDGDARDADYTDTGVNGALAHGSHVAGIIAAAGDNGVGIAGINWRAQVVSARALSGVAGGNNIDVMDAALWLAGGHVDGVPDIDAPVDVINMSLGFAGACDPRSQGIVDDIIGRGVPIIAASGNHGADFGGTTDETVQTPANCEGVISVGAIDFDKKQTAYTNADGRIDIVAPGGTHELGIMSLGATPDAYASQQGTSMATPHVTGVVSLMKALDASLTPDDIRAVLTSLASTCTDCNGVATLDAKAALEAVRHKTDVTGGAGGCSAAPSGSLFALAGLLALARRGRSRRSGSLRIGG